jgi:hypothetical protein
MHDALQPAGGFIGEELNETIQGLGAGRIEFLQLLLSDGIL